MWMCLFLIGFVLFRCVLFCLCWCVSFPFRFVVCLFVWCDGVLLCFVCVVGFDACVVSLCFGLLCFVAFRDVSCVCVVVFVLLCVVCVWCVLLCVVLFHLVCCFGLPRAPRCVSFAS